MIPKTSLDEAIQTLQSGGTIAYPTEAVYGLGCDPFNASAVNKILALKKRPLEKGLILVASRWQQLVPLVQPIAPSALDTVLASWPGPITWVFPASAIVPQWISGNRQIGTQQSVAVRVSDHPIVKQLCDAFGKPIVSTSANISGQIDLIRDHHTVAATFDDQIDVIIRGDVGQQARPSIIKEVISNRLLRG